MTRKIDKIFLFIVIALTLGGFFIFTSAAMSLLSRQGASFGSVAFSQIAFGIVGGGLAAYIMSKIHYMHLKKYALYFFIFSIFLTLLVFVPHIGWAHGGAHRWISIFGQSFQPGEVLKIATLVYMATVFSNLKNKIGTFKYGLLSFLAISAIVGAVFMIQPDNESFGITFVAGLTMFFAAGGKKRHILAIFLLGIVAFGGIVYMRPYVLARVMTFINPAANPLDSGYQVQQSLIAIGSGGLEGRGFGQSLQKFNFLPEAIGDSIFAVAGEEFGFIGSVILVLLFLSFAMRGLKIASKVDEPFGRLLAIGIVILIITQSFMNIAAMLGIIPLSGKPLLFVSQGGTALLFTLLATGIVFNISKYQRKKI